MVGTGYDSNFNLALNTWSHVAATFNNSTDTLRMYVNGSEIYSTTSASASPAANTQPLLIGNSALNEWWQGSLDEVRFRRSIASANEILADYRSQQSPGSYASFSSEVGPPLITSNGGADTASISIPENSTTVTTVSASDSGTPVQTLTYSISGGADANRFAINSSTGVLTFVSAPDFESPTDSGANNVYDLIVQVSDGELADTQTIAVTVTNINEAPHDISGTLAVAENAANGTSAGTVTGNDVDNNPAQAVTLFTENYEAGASGWSTNTTEFAASLTNFLGRFGGSGGAQAIHKTFTLPAGQAQAIVEFDLYRIDSWDGESFRVFINDSQVISVSFNQTGDAGSNGTVGNIAWTLTPTSSSTNLGFGTWTEQTLRVKLVIDSPGSSIKLGFGSTLDQAISDEAYGIDNLSIAASGLRYSLTNSAGGRFTINSSTGEVTVANGLLLDRETAASHSITVRITDAAGATFDKAFAVNLNDVDEFDTGTVIDSNAAANSLAENAANGSTAGITASATDADATTNAITYSLDDSAGGRFAINASTGVVTVADSSLLNYEAATSHSITIRATSADGSFSTQSFTINLTDVDEFDVTPISDNNPAANTLAENSTNGTLIGITASAADADGTTNTITYTLDDSAGGRFAINASTGVVTVANSRLLNFEAATSHSITIRATSADGSFSTQSFTINLTDVDEFDVSAMTDVNAATNSLIENSANGTLIGITASATDADGSTNTITYALDDSAGGRFAINANTGVVTVADSSLLNYEAATTHSITIRATSADGSFSTQSFTINLTDVDEFDVTPVTDSNPAANSLAENSANGTLIGITASATDQDGTTNAVTYSLDDNAGGRFAVDSSTGVVTVADGGLLNFEAATSHSITIRATSADVSFSTQSFTINLIDFDEFDVTPVTDSNPASNSLAENSANGTLIGIVASATDQDGTTNAITYSLDDNAGGRFAVDSSTGVVTVADGGLLNYEAATSHGITIRATSADGSFSTQSFTVNLTDVDEFDVTAVVDSDPAPDQVDENATNGTFAGITATASDPDGTTNSVSFSLVDSAAGRFAIDSLTGVVTVANGSLLNREAAAAHSIIVRATSADGSFAQTNYTIQINDLDEFDVSPPADLNPLPNSVTEKQAAGASVGLTAWSSDSDATNNQITYSLTDDDEGRFSIDASTGVVLTTRSLDRETEGGSRQVTVRAASADGSFFEQIFTITLEDADEFGVAAPSDQDLTDNSVDENAAAGTAVGLTAEAFDADATTNSVTFSLSDDDDGRFTIDASTGVVTTTRPLDRETDGGSRQVTIRATSADGSHADETFQIAIEDLDESSVTTPVDLDAAANEVQENAVFGSLVGVTAGASDLDASQSQVSYQLLDDAGGRFAINPATGVVTVAGPLDYESATEHTLVIRATSQDGSQAQFSVAIAILPLNDNIPTFISPTSYSVPEHEVEIGSLSGHDADLPAQNLSYTISGGPDAAHFTLDSSSGQLRFAALRNFEAPSDADADGLYQVRLRISDGLLWSEQLIEVTLIDENDVPLATPDNWSFDEDTPFNQSVLSNEFDEDGDSLSITLLEGPAHAASFTLHADGTFHYQPATDYFGGDSFRYRVSDGWGGEAEAIVTLTINPVNDAPVSLSNVFTVLQGATLESATGVLFNDSDIENDPLVAILVTPPTRGLLSLQADGSFAYYPERGFIGIDSFTYIASDGVNSGNPATVQVMIEAFAPPPPSVGSSNSPGLTSTSSKASRPTSFEDSEDTEDSNESILQLGGLRPQSNQIGVFTGGFESISNLLPTAPKGAAGNSSDGDFGEGSPSTANLADALNLESELLARATRIRELLINHGLELTTKEVVTTKFKLGERVIEINFGRRHLWEQLAYLQQQLSDQAAIGGDSDLGEVSLELSAVTMAASLGYVLWFLRGSAMMATLVTQVPAWKMIDPLVILDSLDGHRADHDADDTIVGSFFAQ